MDDVQQEELIVGMTVGGMAKSREVQGKDEQVECEQKKQVW